MSIWNLPLAWANSIYIWAYAALVVGAILTGVSTMTLFWTSSIRDRASNEQIQGAIASAEGARRDQIELRNQSLVLQTDLEKERAGRLAMELDLARLKPRVITDQQVESVAKAIAQFAGKRVVISVTYDAACTDCNALSQRFVKMFTMNGFNVRTPSALGISNSPPSGIALRVVDPKNMDPLATAFADSLTDQHISFDIQSGPMIMQSPFSDETSPFSKLEVLVTARPAN